MCVSAVTDKMIAAGSIETVKEHSGIRQTIKDENGLLVSESRFHHMSEDWSTRNFYRAYENGELYKTNLVMKMDFGNRYNPTIKLTGVGQLTKTEAISLVNCVMPEEYVATEVNEDKWGYISHIDFVSKAQHEAELYRESEVVAKRNKKTKELADALIH